MRLLVIAAAAFSLAGPALAQVPLPRVPKGVPSIMVDPDAPKSERRAKKASQKAEEQEKPARSQRIVRRVAPVPLPRSGDNGLGGINRSLEVQQQSQRTQTQNQFELNQLRSGAGGGGLSCTPGSLGC